MNMYEVTNVVVTEETIKFVTNEVMLNATQDVLPKEPKVVTFSYYTNNQRHMRYVRGLNPDMSWSHPDFFTSMIGKILELTHSADLVDKATYNKSYTSRMYNEKATRVQITPVMRKRYHLDTMPVALYKATAKYFDVPELLDAIDHVVRTNDYNQYVKLIKVLDTLSKKLPKKYQPKK